jgi:RNA polymerase sigma-70 factor (ECF subfamily)
VRGGIFLMAMEDTQIIQLYLNRDEKAISETSIKFGNYCNSIAINILNNWEDAEECVNDTYLCAWNSIPPTRPTSLKVYLGRITRNLSFNIYKKMNAEKRENGQTALVLDELAECVSGGCEPEQEFLQKELICSINNFLRALSKEKRIIFVRRYWYSDSISDIADRVGKTENSVSVTLNRLRKMLNIHLRERGFNL